MPWLGCRASTQIAGIEPGLALVGRAAPLGAVLGRAGGGPRYGAMASASLGFSGGSDHLWREAPMRNGFMNPRNPTLPSVFSSVVIFGKAKAATFLGFRSGACVCVCVCVCF